MTDVKDASLSQVCSYETCTQIFIQVVHCISRGLMENVFEKTRRSGGIRYDMA